MIYLIYFEKLIVMIDYFKADEISTDTVAA